MPERRRLKPLRWWWVGGAAVLVVAIGVLLGWWLWPSAAGLTAAEYDRARTEAVRTALTAAGGLAAALALLLAVRRQRSTEVGLDQQDEAAGDARHDATERRVTELYTKAAEQLGSDKALVRLAGLHALERLAQGNSEHRQTIVDVLCAYLRMPYVAPEEVVDPTPEQARVRRRREQEREVRLTAQRILANHLRPAAPASYWPGIDLNLAGATLVELDLSGCHLRDATFTGATFEGDTRFTTAVVERAWFTHARFDGPAKFVATQFRGHAWFRKAEFNADVLFRKTTFGGDTGFRSTVFRGDAYFAGAEFQAGALFVGAVFGRTARFTKARFGGETKFTDVRFDRDTWLRQAYFDREVWFTDSDFTGTASFTGTVFADGVSFENTRFSTPPLTTGTQFNGIVTADPRR